MLIAAGAACGTVLGAALGGACSQASPSNAGRCTTTPDCTAQGGSFARSVCVDGVCSLPDASSHGDARHDVAVEAARDGRRDGPTDAGRSRDATSPVDAPPVNDWSCLGHVQWPDASAQRVTLTEPYVNLVTDLPIPGVRVQPCLPLDTTCATPVSEAGVTNDAGLVTLSVPSGYDGYLLSLWDASFPTLVYISPPVFQSRTQLPVPLLSTTAMGVLTAAMGTVDGAAVTVDPARGQMGLGAYDCAMAKAVGVSFSLSPAAPSSILVYLVGGLPSPTATSTDSDGFAAIVNVPPGTFTVTATLAATHQVIGTVTALSEAAHVMDFYLVPSP